MKALYNGCTFEFDLEGETYTEEEYHLAARGAVRKLIEDQHAENAALRAEVERWQARLHTAEALYRLAEAEVERRWEAVLTAYRKGHHHTVNGGYQWCDQGGREVVEEIISEAGEEE